MTDDSRTGRRRTLKALAIASGAVGCGVLAIPTVGFLVAPAHGGPGVGRWIKTVRLASLREGEPKRVSLIADHRDAWTLEKEMELGAAWILRQGDGVLAWSVTCPHLGCAIDKSAGKAGFSCPCHDSAFDSNGRRLSGPSPRDLDSLATRVDDGFVMVEFRRFRQGVPEKASVG